MRATDMTELSDHAQGRRPAPPEWPWVLAVSGWAFAVPAGLTHRTDLIARGCLLRQSRRRWPVTRSIFRTAWQGMRVAMMLPSSMPMTYRLVYASRRQARPHAVQAALLAG